jgi:hypothetical protein
MKIPQKLKEELTDHPEIHFCVVKEMKLAS